MSVMTVDTRRRWTRAEARRCSRWRPSPPGPRAGRCARRNAGPGRPAHRLDRQKTDFMATVSHELRTPLTSISGYLELLAGRRLRRPDRGAALDACDVIGRNATRLRGLIEDLLVLNRIESSGLHVDRQDVCLGELVRTRPRCSPRRRRRGGVDVEVAGLRAGRASSTGRRGPPGARRSSTCGPTRSSSPPPAVGSSSPSRSCPRAPTASGPRVRVCCRDSGIGIPEADLPQLFVALLPRRQRGQRRDPRHGSRPGHRRDDRGGPRRLASTCVGGGGGHRRGDRAAAGGAAPRRRGMPGRGAAFTRCAPLSGTL